MGNTLIVSVDHGYKHMKTESEELFFPTCLSELKSMPDSKKGILKYNNRIFTEHGEPVKNYDTQVKTDSDEFYILTLIALAKELRKRSIYNAEITLLGGLPQRWYDKQKESFKEYLLSGGENVFFEYEGKPFNIVIREVQLFEQGYSAFFALPNVINYLDCEACVVDIGGGTIDILPILNGELQRMDCKIDTHATIWMNDEIKEAIETELASHVSDSTIIKYITSGSISEPPKNKYEEVMQEKLADYCDFVYSVLKKFRINVDLVPIIFVGGGAIIMKNFTRKVPGTCEYVTDLCANAKGYKKIYELILKG